MSEPELVDAVERSANLDGVVLGYAYRGIHVQLVLRGMLLLFIALTLFFVPPAHGARFCLIVLALYVAWSLAVALWTRRGGLAPVKLIWLTLLVDLTVFGGLTLLTGIKSQESWTATIFINGLILIPLLACMQLDPRICAGVAAPTVLVFLLASWLAFDTEPWSVILLTTMMIAGLGAGAVAVSWIQRSRVRTIGGLVIDRTRLLAELVNLEQRERQALSEQLHDGVLQYVLAARQDLLEYDSNARPQTLERVHGTLKEVSNLLRTTVAELHPAVLEHVGLPRAIWDLAKAASTRGGFEIDIDTSWPDDHRTSADGLLFSVARELLNNVVKHAGAKSVFIELRLEGKWVTLRIEDDGRGIALDDLNQSLADGHIGIASYHLRVVAAGGRLSICRGKKVGTVAHVEVPCTEIPFNVVVRPVRFDD
ncbi:ATP-binding protein [Rhodococcus erythropolis]|uniref:sensor histidine kinase n=1 Tax=Rhodococcus erythropolis TaxID=1833 RepID=UPI002948C6ED|nr:ATP-binding protein [Rhodococcus erythropolis]MDV6277513.1 ATP-binding protein [Rhodococcus erythropolis]